MADGITQLVLKFQNKDALAFEKLYQMYAENICGAIHAIIKNPERSQELCQDVFVKVWEKSDQYDSSKGRFFTWLLNMARNMAIDELRSKSFKNQKQNLYTTTFVDIVEDTESQERPITREALEKLIKNLKDKCILLIDMLYFKGYTQKEAAKALDKPVGTIKTRIRACISEIRKQMKL